MIKTTQTTIIIIKYACITRVLNVHDSLSKNDEYRCKQFKKSAVIMFSQSICVKRASYSILVVFRRVKNIYITCIHKMLPRKNNDV